MIRLYEWTTIRQSGAGSSLSAIYKFGRILSCNGYSALSSLFDSFPVPATKTSDRIAVLERKEEDFYLASSLVLLRVYVCALSIWE